jgi:hypothetical protein
MLRPNEIPAAAIAAACLALPVSATLSMTGDALAASLPHLIDDAMIERGVVELEERSDGAWLSVSDVERDVRRVLRAALGVSDDAC